MSHKGKTEIEIGSLLDLIHAQDEGMQKLFAKALNLYVSPASNVMPEREKLDQLKRAVEESIS